ncbi:MAG: response regulator transcription factor [Campylobacterales bacterium]|nr:response regulator transcription factor [Campylobacterales bacterium]
MGTILVVEDEQDLLELIEFSLIGDGHKVYGFENTNGVKNCLDEKEIDLIIMDRILPNVEGSDFIQKIRQQRYNHPVIYVSGKNSTDDIIDGFNKGGDDYISKPFEIDILKARVNAVLKRTKQETEVTHQRDITYMPLKKRFYIEDKEMDLTVLERNLMLEFFKNRNVLLTRDMIIDAVWKGDKDIKKKTVNVAIKRLKEKIDPKGEKEYIQTVRGEGYMFS